MPYGIVGRLLQVHLPRQAGHWLAVALLAVLFLAGTADVARLYQTIGNVQAELKRAQSDNATWQVAQGEVDLLRYRLAVLQAKESGSNRELAEARQAYDILYSRVTIIDGAFRNTAALQIADLEDQWTKMRAVLLQQTAIIDRSDAELRVALPRLAALNAEAARLSRSFSVDALQAIVKAAMEQREEMQWLMKRAFASGALMYFLLVALALALKLALTRSRRQAIDLTRLSSKLSKVINSSVDAILVADGTGRINDCNSAARAKFGLSQVEALDRNLGNLISVDSTDLLADEALPDDSSSVFRPDAAFEGRPFQAVAKRADGTEFPAEVLTVSDRGTDGTRIYIVYVRDVSEEVKAQAALVSARDLALQGEQSKARFIAVMNHEMRTPLNGLIAALDILQTTTRTSKRQARFLTIARQCSTAALEQIDDVLELARLDDRAQFENTEVFDIVGILEDLVSQNHLLAEQRGNRLVTQLTDLPDTLVVGHRRLLGRALYNLLGNAIKFTENGLIKLRLSVKHEADAMISACFAVEDTGIGIPADKLGGIFRDFETVDRSYAHRAEGTGLGLGIAKRAVEQMGGVLGVASEEDKGSTFWFRIPLSLAYNPKPTSPGEVAERQMSSEDRRPAHVDPTREILIAEDNAINRVVLREMLRHIGCRVDEARNGLEAVRRAASKDYDLILMDLSMPELDGIEATRQIRTSEPHCRARIVGLTAHAMASDYARMLNAGMEFVLQKPITIASLRALLAKPAEPGISAAEKHQRCREHFLLDTVTCTELAQLMSPGKFTLILRRFINETEQILKNLEPAADLRQCTLALHKLVGSSAYFGAKALRTLVLVCEENARAGHANTVAELLPAIQICWIETRDALAEFAGIAENSH